jgi:hypothetical protein
MDLLETELSFSFSSVCFPVCVQWVGHGVWEGVCVCVCGVFSIWFTIRCVIIPLGNPRAVPEVMGSDLPTHICFLFLAPFISNV